MADDIDLTEATEAARAAYFDLSSAPPPEGPPVWERIVKAVAPLLIEQGRWQGRQEAADAILAHADRYAPEPSALHRALHIAARVATSPPTIQEVADAIEAGDAIVCRLADDGTPIRDQEARDAD